MHVNWRRSARRLSSPILRRLRNEHRSWIETLETVSVGQWPEFKMYGVIASWMEGDVIEATIRNAFDQGCDRVYLIDNDSPDDTVAKARRAGAIVWCEFRTDQYDEKLRIALVGELVQRISADAALPIWWLLLDADEFPHGPDGLTVREYLATLDRRCRVVGCDYFNHYPTDEPHYVPGEDPLRYQRMAEFVPNPGACAQGHRKHNLLLEVPGQQAIWPNVGFHTARSAERPLVEPRGGIIVHHFPFRLQQDTVRRLDILCKPTAQGERRAPLDDMATTHMLARQRTAAAVYAGDWSEVETLAAHGLQKGLTLRDWNELATEVDQRRRSPT